VFPRSFFAAFCLLAAPGLLAAFESPLSSGVTFPDLVGKTLSGSDIRVGMRDGWAKVMVMSFTGEAAKSSQAWLEACRADPSAKLEPVPTESSPLPVKVGVVCYDVRMVASLPPIVRGVAEGRMKKGQRPEHLDQIVLIHKDKDIWRDRLAVILDNEDDPFIVMIDRQGRVQSLLQGPFNPAALKAEQAKLLASPPPSVP
jgi:hypothetical protein